MERPSSENPATGLLSRAVRSLILWHYHRQGWTAVGTIPQPRRFVLIAAPHTSNWDFVNFLGLTQEVGFQPHFMGKKALFGWPMRRFMLDMGGVPVDRSSSQNYVQQMIDEFGRRDEFMLTIAPEGTRNHAAKWKTGFYHIAMGAKVPLVLGFMDYAKKRGGLGPVVWPTGDYKADMAAVMSFYNSCTPKHPEKATIYVPEDSDA